MVATAAILLFARITTLLIEGIGVIIKEDTEMSTNRKAKDIAIDAATTAAIIELIGAVKIGLMWAMQEDSMPKTKTYLSENFEILRTNFTK